MNSHPPRNRSLLKIARSARPSMNCAARLTLALSLCAMLLLSGPASIFAQSTSTRTSTRPASAARAKSAARSTAPAHPAPKPPARESQQNEDGTITAGFMQSDYPVQLTTSELMEEQKVRGPEVEKEPRPRKGRVEPDRENLPEAPGAIEAPQWPLPEDSDQKPGERGRHGTMDSADSTPSAPQTLGTQFDGATGPTETGAFPPDTMGAVGPTQYFVFLNGRLRTFNKTTGVADGVINADSDVFFASVMTPPNAGEVVFTSDPQVRYDRHSGRWFLNIIDVVLNASTGAITRPNRVLLAVSNAGSTTITGSTVWTFYQFQGDATLFTDYQSLGIDRDALYIGGDMFTTAGAFNSTKGFVIPKAPLLTASPATVWAFSGLVATPTGAGPFAPRGVDNFDSANTGPTAQGYFIGVDNATFNTLMVRRVTNPGSLGPAPTISANIAIATPLTTRFPVLVPHLGNTGGTGGRLDALDDRLFAAMMHKGRLWTAHNIGVNNTGVAGATNNRNASRWYEIQNLNATPSIVQSGTLFDNSAPNDANQRNYWIPSIAVSGQGHAAMGTSIAGTGERINAFTTGRLVGDTLGTMRDGPGGAALPGYTASATAYNPPGDPGGPARRWGDYSFTSVDPLDDMTMWTIQEYCNGTNTYGVRAVRLIAPPPPPTATAAPASIPDETASNPVTVTGVAPAGQGFYDPGANLPAPALPFNHISASATGGVTVNSITFTDPTHVNINFSTVGATPGPQNVTITNPDGQAVTYPALITVTPSGPATGQVLISEFRFTGAAGGNDEFIELYNNTDLPITVAASDASAGWGVYGTNTTGGMSLRFTVPNGTVIPARGHYLGANTAASGYSLGAVATPDATYTTGVVPGGGVALFTTATLANISAANRLDSVGFAGITGANTNLFFEGTALSPAGGISTSGEHSFLRRYSTATGLPQDSDNNNNDFIFVSTTGLTFNGRVSILGAPGPENLASPLFKPNAIFPGAPLDSGVSNTLPPNRVRTQRVACPPASSPGIVCDNTKSNAGTMEIRRKYTNNTGVPVTRLRFRIIEVTTLNNRLASEADLRALTNSGNFSVTLSAGGGGGSVTVQNLTLEAPSDAVTMGGGMNSTVAAGTITTGTPLANGANINVNFMLGVQVAGNFRFFIIVEALP